MEKDSQPKAGATEWAEGAPGSAADRPQEKQCVYCGAWKPLREFKRRSGRRSGRTGRRGACRDCRRRRLAEAAALAQAGDSAGHAVDATEPSAAHEPAGTAAEPARHGDAAEAPKAARAAAPLPAEAGGAKRRRRRRRRGAKAKAAAFARAAAAQAQAQAPGAQPAPQPIRRVRRPLPAPPPRPEGPDASVLTPTRKGVIKMRGKTDKGRRWVQDTDLETAVNLVREHAAVVVNRHTIRRLYSNKSFRQYILTRDRYTCYFCGEYGDTIDHLVPRAKGGHTTPMNCVCACHLCNQSKADRNLDEFVAGGEEEA